MRPARIDSLQYCNWSRERLIELREGGVDAVHVTVAYHENFRETAANIARWNDLFADHGDLVMPGRNAADIETARQSGLTAVFFGLQNCSSMEGDIRTIETLHALGVRFMQLTYNNQSLLAGGCWEPRDSGISRMGREAIAEMNRVGMAVDMSHSGDDSTLQAIEISNRPVAVTHANPRFWHDSARNKSDSIMRALAEQGGMLGLSLYPLHLKGGSNCSLQSFCDMAARAADIMGAQHLGIGSDLCLGHSDSIIAWMRNGIWRKPQKDDSPAVLPPQPEWFRSAADFGRLREGLCASGFGESEADGILGENWLRYFKAAFSDTR